MVKLITLLSIVLFSFNPIIAQSGTISGKVVDNETDEPMPFANVLLFHLPDSSQISGSVTGKNGNFIFNNISMGKYFIKVNFLGYEDFQSESFFHKNKTEIGIIKITPSSILLDEVNVSGEESSLISKLDKRVYNVGKDIQSQSGSISEILQNIPSVSVDVNGNVSLRGTSNITFLINGRPSALLRRNASMALQQIPANSIERIEVITNPSAKYKPDGIGGVINIIRKKNSETNSGVSGQVNASAGNEQRIKAGINLNYANTNVSSFLNYSIKHSAGSVLFSDNRISKDSATGNIKSIYNESGNSQSKPWAHIASGGITYDINDNNNLEISGDYFYAKTKHSGISNINITDGNKNPINSLTSHSTNDEYESEGEASAVYEHSFDKEGEHTISLEATFTAYDEQENLAFIENQSFPLITSSSKNMLTQKSGNQTEVKSEYVLPINDEQEFNAGYVGEFYSDDIRYSKELIKNRFILNQAIHALYGIYKQSVGDFSFQFGLRGEAALLNSHLVTPNDSLINNNYYKLYPTIHLGYKIAENQNIKLSYSKRINRPDADELNPYPEFIDPRNAEGGNPNLKPEQIHSLELTYQLSTELFTFTPSLYYRYKYNAFTQISKPIGNDVILYTIENLANKKSGGLELIFSGGVSGWLDLDLSGNLFYDQIDASNIGYSNKKDIIAASAKLNSFINLSESTFLQLNFYYYSPSITPQGKIKNRYYMNIGIKQQIFNKKVDLILTASDVFHTYKSRWNVDTKTLIQSTSIYRKEPVYYLGINWRFGNNEKKESKLNFEGEGLRK
jgi:outer membrane receptor protein involved in Fe transport